MDSGVGWVWVLRDRGGMVEADRSSRWEMDALCGVLLTYVNVSNCYFACLFMNFTNLNT